MIKIAICEDMNVYLNLLTKSINQWAMHRGFHTKVSSFSEGEALLADIEEYGDYQIILMDICMKGLNGLDTASQIRKNNQAVCIIFISQYENYCIKAFEVRPLHYFWKPIKLTKLYEIMDHAVKWYIKIYESYFFYYNRKTHSILLSEVLYFYSEKRKIKIVMTGNREYVYYGKLDSVEQDVSQYASPFLRIHQSFLINTYYVEEYRYQDVLMRNLDVLAISFSKKDEVKEYHMNLLENK